MKLRNRQLGQGMTEYIIIVGLIAILLIAAVKTFREQCDHVLHASDLKEERLEFKIYE